MIGKLLCKIGKHDWRLIKIPLWHEERYIRNLENRVEALESRIDCIGDYRGETRCLFNNCPFVDKCMELQELRKKEKKDAE